MKPTSLAPYKGYCPHGLHLNCLACHPVQYGRTNAKHPTNRFIRPISPEEYAALLPASSTVAAYLPLLGR